MTASRSRMWTSSLGVYADGGATVARGGPPGAADGAAGGTNGAPADGADFIAGGDGRSDIYCGFCSGQLSTAPAGVAAMTMLLAAAWVMTEIADAELPALPATTPANGVTRNGSLTIADTTSPELTLRIWLAASTDVSSAPMISTM